MPHSRRGPVIGRPGADHPYYDRGGWGDLMYGRRYDDEEPPEAFSGFKDYF